jgi:non-specific serine/threonine protein kinase
VSNRDTGEQRVCKFVTDDEYLVDLRREVALALLLRDRLAGSDAFVPMTQWEFEQPPFFVESAFGGPNLYERADEGARLRSMPTARRVEIAAAMVDAVGAAHGVGVVHMDLKPSNVLVAPAGDGGWLVRVVDFGSGRSLDRTAIDRLEVQRLGLSVTQVVEGRPGGGTADYVAPEVRRGAEVVIPTVCDVFALGVMLYQLISGDLRKPLAPGWERDIDDPLLREDIALATDGNPRNRLQSASSLRQRLHDLEARRAEIAAAMARAARDDALRAQAQIDRERRRQLEARRPWVVATLVVMGVSLAAVVWQWRGAQVAHASAEASAAQAQAVTRFLNEDVLGMADPFRAEAPTPAIRQALQRAIASADRAFVGQPRTEAAVRATLAGLLDRNDDPQAAEAQWRATVALWRGWMAPRRPARCRRGIAPRV